MARLELILLFTLIACVGRLCQVVEGKIQDPAQNDLVVELVDELAGYPKHESTLVKYSTTGTKTGHPSGAPKLADFQTRDMPLIHRMEGKFTTTLDIHSISLTKLFSSLRDTLGELDLETFLRTCLRALGMMEEHFESVYTHLEAHRALIQEFFSIDLPAIRGIVKNFNSVAQVSLGRLLESGIIQSVTRTASGQLRAVDLIPMLQMVSSMVGSHQNAPPQGGSSRK